MANFDGVVHEVEEEEKEDGELSSPVTVMSSEFFLDHVGDVILTLDSDSLSRKSLEYIAVMSDKCNCLRVKRASPVSTGIKLSDVYALELMDKSTPSAPVKCPWENHPRGGDGFFNEILDGLLCLQHKAPYPPAPAEFVESLGDSIDSFIANANERIPEISSKDEDQSPLISTNGSHFSSFRSEDNPYKRAAYHFGYPFSNCFMLNINYGWANTDKSPEYYWYSRSNYLRIANCVGETGPLDIVHIVRWKTTSASKVKPCVRYAASFAGYGFYGDVITESEKYCWMGPTRYDYAGTKVFLRHRSY